MYECEISYDLQGCRGNVIQLLNYFGNSAFFSKALNHQTTN